MAAQKESLTDTIKDHLAIAVSVVAIVSAVAGWTGSWAVGQRNAGKQAAEIGQLQRQVAELKKPVNQNPTLEQCVSLSKAQAAAVEALQLTKADEYRELMTDLGCQNVNSRL